MMSTYKKINVRIVRVHIHSESDLVLSGITDETLVIRQRDIRKGCAVSLIEVSNDFYTIILPDTNATRRDVNKYMKNRMRDWLTSKLSS
jgi:hypothetical protein